MKPIRDLLVGTVGLFGAIAGSVTLAQQPKEDLTAFLPPGTAKALVASRCSVCHDLRTVVRPRKTETGWRLTVEDMLNRGASILPEEEAQIAAYLGAAFAADAPPYTDVNLADQKDLTKLPGITPEIAERLVAHRTAKGPFASRDEVQTVSGLDEAAFGKIRWYLRAAGPGAQQPQGPATAPSRPPIG